MKKAIMYGAGNIGRGFIGQLFSQSGYEVVFLASPQGSVTLTSLFIAPEFPRGDVALYEKFYSSSLCC